MHATQALLEGVLAAIAVGREPPSSGREARDVMAVIEAAYHSAETGQRIELNWDAIRSAQAEVSA